MKKAAFKKLVKQMQSEHDHIRMPAEQKAANSLGHDQFDTQSGQAKVIYRALHKAVRKPSHSLKRQRGLIGPIAQIVANENTPEYYKHIFSDDLQFLSEHADKSVRFTAYDRINWLMHYNQFQPTSAGSFLRKAGLDICRSLCDAENYSDTYNLVPGAFYRYVTPQVVDQVLTEKFANKSFAQRENTLYLLENLSDGLMDSANSQAGYGYKGRYTTVTERVGYSNQQLHAVTIHPPNHPELAVASIGWGRPLPISSEHHPDKNMQDKVKKSFSKQYLDDADKKVAASYTRILDHAMMQCNPVKGDVQPQPESIQPWYTGLKRLILGS